MIIGIESEARTFISRDVIMRWTDNPQDRRARGFVELEKATAFWVEQDLTTGLVLVDPVAGTVSMRDQDDLRVLRLSDPFHVTFPNPSAIEEGRWLRYQMGDNDRLLIGESWRGPSQRNANLLIARRTSGPDLRIGRLRIGLR